MRRQQYVHVELLEQIGVTDEVPADQQGRLMGIGDDFLEEMIAAVGRVADYFHAEPDVSEILGGGMEMAALFVEKSLAVGDEELEVAHLRLIDRGEIDFVEHAGGGREPQA